MDALRGQTVHVLAKTPISRGSSCPAVDVCSSLRHIGVTCCTKCIPHCCSHTLADLALQVAEAILDKAQPKQVRGKGPPRSAPGETPLPTKFYRAGGSGGEIATQQGFVVMGHSCDLCYMWRQCGPVAANLYLGCVCYTQLMQLAAIM